jgi:hypothetical protein
MLDNQPFIENKEASTLAQAIVDTVREPLLVLDKDLRVLAAWRPGSGWNSAWRDLR